MQLEVISHLPKVRQQRPPILFVHGAFSGAWCWNEYFLPYFAKQGYPTYAVSLRGHGNSAGREKLYLASLADYVADVVQVSVQLEQLPILVGHSMGGMVIQKYLERGHPAVAAVLMASVPPQGLWPSLVYLSLSNPLLFWQLNLVHYVSLRLATPTSIKKALFSKTMPEQLLAKYLIHLQGESQRVIWDMLWLDLPNSCYKPTLPILVLGAENDVFFSKSMVEKTAQFYGTQARIFPDMAHTMMLEAAWQSVADEIIDWLVMGN